MSIKNKISSLIPGIIILILFLYESEQFERASVSDKIISGTVIIIIYMLTFIYIRKRLTKYRKVNKTLLRDSMMAGIIFSIAAYIFVIYVCGFE